MPNTVRRLRPARIAAAAAACVALAATAAHADLVVDPPLPGGRGPGGNGEGDGAPALSAAAQPLVGTFRVSEGKCSGNVTGSWFRMVQPGGNPTSGPWVQNADSPCSDDTYTPLSPGSDGGLVTGSYQPNPTPAFDGTGGGRADRIIKPQLFFGVRFAAATNPRDPQTGLQVTAPEVVADGTRLSGDLRSFAAAWNNQHFNQGSPKPDGQRPGNTAGPAGTYNARTGAFTLEWTSQIVGGPFNNFTGKWHLEGTFVPASSSSESSPAGGGTTQTTTRSATAERSAARGTSPAPAAASTPGHPRTGGAPQAALGTIALALSVWGLRLRRAVTAP